jgi:hypothetical protein
MKTPSQKKIELAKRRKEVKLLYNYLVNKRYLGFHVNPNKILIESTSNIFSRFFRNLISEKNIISEEEITFIEEHFEKMFVHYLNDVDLINIEFILRYNSPKTYQIKPDTISYLIIFRTFKELISEKIKEEIINKMVNDKINDIISFKDLLIEKI